MSGMGWCVWLFVRVIMNNGEVGMAICMVSCCGNDHLQNMNVDLHGDLYDVNDRWYSVNDHLHDMKVGPHDMNAHRYDVKVSPYGESVCQYNEIDKNEHQYDENASWEVQERDAQLAFLTPRHTAHHSHLVAPSL